ncbi:MAG: leucine-rich repeat domain-containing protein [Paludibacteraceae bacterium]
MKKAVLFLTILAFSMNFWAADIPKSWYKLSDDGTILKIWKVERSVIDLQNDKAFSNLTIVGKMAFCNLRGLETVILPNSVVSIEQSAFEYCAGLVGFNAPSKLVSIDRSAFGKCTTLKTVKLTATVAKIGELAFAGCTLLTEIKSENPIPPSIQSNTFDYVDKQNCVLYVPKGSKAKYSVDDGWKEFKNIVER